MNRPVLLSFLLIVTVALVTANLFAQTNKPPVGAKPAPIGAKPAPLGPKPAPIGAKPPTISTVPTGGVIDTTPASSAPSTTQKAFDEAEGLYSAGEWEKALAAFRKFETNYPISTARCPAQYFEGWCLFNLKRYDEALKTLTAMMTTYKESPLIPEATLKMAECYRELKNYAAALQQYQAFQKKFPKNQFIPQARLGEAWMLLKTKNVAEAKRLVQEVLAAHRYDPTIRLDATFMLAQIYNEDKQYDQARALFRSIADESNNPRATDALFAQGETYYELKDYPQAITYYKRVQPTGALLANIAAQVDLLTSQRAALVKAGTDISTVNYQLQQWQSLNKIVSQREDLRPVALFRIANCYQEMKQPEEASVVYRTLLEKYPTHKTTEFSYYGLIQALTESKRLAEANPLVEEFKAKFPKSDLLNTAGYMQAISIFGAKRYDEALERFEKFLPNCTAPDMKESVEYYIAACNYALAAEKTALYPKAVTLFSAFRTKYPASKLLPEVLFRLGRCQYEVANQPGTKPEEARSLLAAAIGQFEEIRAQHPKFDSLPQVTFQLGYLYTYLAAFDRDPKTGAFITTANYDKAIAAFNAFLQGWPNLTDDQNRPLGAEADYQIAHSHLAVKRFDKAIEAFQNLIATYPESDLAPYAAYETSDAYAQLKQTDKALDVLRAYTDKYPNHAKVADALFLLADNLKAKQPDEAIKTFTTLIERTAANDKNRETWLPVAMSGLRQIITLRAQRDDIKGAGIVCDDALAKFSAYPTAARAILGEMVTLYRRAKLADEGFAKLNLIAQQSGANSALRIAALTAALDLALANKDYPRATESGTRLLSDPEKDKLPALTYIALGNLFLKTDKHAHARDIFSKVITAYAADTASVNIAQLGLGQALLSLKDFAGAEKAFNAQMPQDPKQALPEALLGLGQVYEEKARGKDIKDPLNIKAVEFYTLVAKSGRRDLINEAFYRLGNFFFNANDKKAALPYFMRLLFAPEPLLEEGMFRSAECHESLNNLPMALNAYRNYKKRYPTGKYAARADQKIAEITPKVPAQ